MLVFELNRGGGSKADTSQVHCTATRSNRLVLKLFASSFLTDIILFKIESEIKLFFFSPKLTFRISKDDFSPSLEAFVTRTIILRYKPISMFTHDA